MINHYELGRKGEEIAQEYLSEKRYTILEKNWRYYKNEIDLIAMKDDKIIFVEVKCRTSDYFEHPWEAVKKKKQKSIIKAADAYIKKNDINKEARFDIISIIFSETNFEIEHIEDAFYPLV
ncbi:MAG: YraN family protein [Bacteroidia bacterium]|nr:YraN family protein [Bacteroidia bacterium]